MTRDYIPKITDVRELGQVWTPDWVAEAMAAYTMSQGAESLFDPACGNGSLLAAGKRFAARKHTAFLANGMDVDLRVLDGFKRQGLDHSDMNRIRIGDYLADPPDAIYPAIAVNPPYVRHHRIGGVRKRELQSMVMGTMGRRIDARAGLHVYFLIQSLKQLAPNGRLAFIVSSDICEGVFSRQLWDWVLRTYRLDAVLQFSPEASPFPHADTNAILFLIQNSKPRSEFIWARCLKEDPISISEWIESGFEAAYPNLLEVQTRTVSEASATGLSRPPSHHLTSFTLGDVASVMRGIATGANDFFLMTREQASHRNLPSSFLKPCISRVRDLDGDRITEECLDRLERKGRPTLLLNIPPSPFEELPLSVQDWIREGESLGLHNRPLIKTRRPWYRMEQRRNPPLLFAYLGRRDCRFILNEAGVVPLSCLLCVYPKSTSAKDVWQALNRPETIANLASVGKSYGGGAIKVEPRALERLPIPDEIMEGLAVNLPIQEGLFNLATG
ncbi:MAG: N-6 DNA methylase [Acidobacteria bacterium]|nr:N-6 DNA methylase [Acidobacteriota bacterium]